MRGHGAKFSRKMEEAIAALLKHRNHEEAARAAGIGTATLLRWEKLAEFRKAYRQARRLAFGQGMARLQQASGAAGSTLLKLAVDPGTPAAVKARAAYYILTLGTKAFETEDIEERVAELERAAELSKQGR